MTLPDSVKNSRQRGTLMEAINKVLKGKGFPGDVRAVQDIADSNKEIAAQDIADSLTC